jgi:hypothetical protein
MATATLIHTDEEIQKDVLAELRWKTGLRLTLSELDRWLGRGPCPPQ